MLIRPERATKAFTLLELIVGIVILGILAALAIPTFSRVVERSRDATTAASVAAILRDTQALVAFGDTSWEDASKTAISETGAKLAASGFSSTGLSAASNLSAKDVAELAIPTFATATYRASGTAGTGATTVALLSETDRVCFGGATATSVGKVFCADVVPASASASVASGTVSSVTMASVLGDVLSGTSTVAPIGGTLSDAAPVTPVGPVAPFAPGNVTVTPGPATLNVSWAAAAATTSPVTGYKVSITASGTTTERTVPADTLTLSITERPAVLHSVTVTALSDAGASPASSPASATPAVASVPSAAPVLVVTQSHLRFDTLKRDLSWGAVASTTSAPVSGYRVYSAPAATGPWTLSTTTTSTTGAALEATYGTPAVYYKVHAYGPAGEGAASNVRGASPRLSFYHQASTASAGITPSAWSGLTFPSIGTWSSVSLNGTTALLAPQSSTYDFAVASADAGVTSSTQWRVFDYVDNQNYWRAGYSHNGSQATYTLDQVVNGIVSNKHSRSFAIGKMSGSVITVYRTPTQLKVNFANDTTKTFDLAAPANAKVGFGGAGTYTEAYVTYGL